MEVYFPIAFGFALGLVGTLIGRWLDRRKEARDNEAYNRKIVRGLVKEIEEGVERVRTLVKMRNAQKVSLSRIYTALWQSTNQRLASTLADDETLTLLHGIYYRFDLINFNCEMGRPGVAGAFAADYLPTIEADLAKLKNADPAQGAA